MLVTHWKQNGEHKSETGKGEEEIEKKGKAVLVVSRCGLREARKEKMEMIGTLLCFVDSLGSPYMGTLSRENNIAAL